MIPQQAAQNDATEFVPVYYDFGAVLKNALAVGALGAAAIVAAALAGGRGALFSMASVAGALCLLFALSRVIAAGKQRHFARRQAYARFQHAGITLLDTLNLPWSAVDYLKISRLAWPRRTYLLVGMKPSHAAGSIPAALTADNMLIALASREATGAVLEPHTFLSLCIEANWSPLAPVALTHDARQIAGLAETYFHELDAAADRDGAVRLFQSAQEAYRSGAAEQARALCRQVLDQDGEHDEAWFMLALIARAGGEPDQAEAALRRALALREHPAYAANLGLLLQETGRHGEAEALYLRVVELDPQSASAPNNLGLIYWKAGRPAEAAAWLGRAIAQDPALAEAHGNLGIVQKELGQFADAEASSRRALELQPQSARFHNNLGLLFQDTGRQHEAQQEFLRALDLAPDYSPARYNLGLTRLALEDFARGLPDLEARYDPAFPESPVPLPALPFPQWRGESLAGKRLVIWPEQGFGDYIQFARYFPLLKQQGLMRLTVCCSAVLAPVLRTVAGVDAIVSEQDELPEQDYWAFPMSLALRCGSDAHAIPASLPYLHALPERLAPWQALLQNGKPKVGLVWAGAADHKNDANRSLPSLAVLSPLWDDAGVQFVSLQKGRGEDEAQAAADAGRLLHLGSRIADLGDSAAIVARLDLVICVDTAVAHLAGGMGKRCWVLLPAVGCDWRWHVARADSPWYPGVMRLFRQRRPGDWSEAVSELARALREAF